MIMDTNKDKETLLEEYSDEYENVVKMDSNLDNIMRDEIFNKNSDALHAEITDMFYRYFLPTMLGIEVEHNEPEDNMIPVDFKEVVD